MAGNDGLIIVYTFTAILIIVAGLLTLKSCFCLTIPEKFSHYSETRDVENQKDAKPAGSATQENISTTAKLQDNRLLNSPANSILPNGIELQGTIIRRDGCLFRQALDLQKRQVMLKLGSSYEEIRILCNYNHPNIIELYGTFAYEEMTVLVLEWTPRSLKNILNCSKLERESVLFIAKEVTNALAFLHSNGIAFCNLKAKNVVQSYSSSNRFKLLGFRSAVFDVTFTRVDTFDFGSLLFQLLAALEVTSVR